MCLFSLLLNLKLLKCFIIIIIIIIMRTNSCPYIDMAKFCANFLTLTKSPYSQYRTRRFIGEELILAIGDFSENSPILITTWTRPQSHCRNSKRKTW